MEIKVNKETITIPQGFKIIELLGYLKYSRSVAVFVNGKQLLMSEYDNFSIEDKDNVRIIKPLGGG